MARCVAIEGPQIKRIRLSPPSDDSSPFHDASQDVIDHIFRCLTETKSKMKLELVCSKFRQRITQRSCWTDSRLKLGYNQQTNKVVINGTEFDSNIASNALIIYLQRADVRRVQFESVSWPSKLALDVQTQIILHHGSFALREVTFGLDLGTEIEILDIGSTILLSSLAPCDLSQMSSIKIISNPQQEITEDFKSYFWPFVFRCPNLTTLSLKALVGTGVEDRTEDIISHCPKLETVEIFDHSGAYLDELFDNLPQLKSINLQITSFDIPLIQSLDETTRSRIETLKLSLDSDDEYCQEFLVTVPTLLPNLKKFVPVERYVFGDSWDKFIVVNLIQNVVNQYTGHGPYKFILKNIRVDDTEAFLRLLRAMNVNIERKENVLEILKDELIILVYLI